jgi:uncharacterized protein YvpB
VPVKSASLWEIDILTQSESKVRFLAAGLIVIALILVNRCRPALNASISPAPGNTPVQVGLASPVVARSSPTPQPSETPAPSTPDPTLTETARPSKAARTSEAAASSETAVSSEAAPTQSSSPTPAIPEEHYIDNVRGHKQFFPLGCETGVAVDWAAYFGVTIVEYNFQYELPKSDNPDFGFVGDVRSPWGQTPPYGYGVHAAPIADLLRTKYGLPAKAVKNLTLDQVKSELASDQPMIAWVIGNMVGGVPAEFIDSQGNRTIVAAYEHVVLLTGYNQEKIRYNNNGKFYEAPNKVFLNSWGVLGNMAVIYDN